MTQFPTLTSPIRCGPLEMAGRLVSTAHQTGLVEDHLPTEDLVAYHEARAAGGVAAIFLEATAVHPTGLLTPHTLGGYLPRIVGGYERLSSAVHRHGAAMLVQLFHGGREVFGGAPRAPAVAPSAVPSLRFHSEPRALTQAEIDELVEGYARAAGHARDGGLDGVEISMAHGYLAAQFLNPATNRRTDGYGGDLDARTRFALEILDAVRGEVGRDIAVGVRLSASELTPEGQAPAEAAEIAARVRASGLVDFVSLALGHSASYRGSVWIAPPVPLAEDAIAQHLPAGAGDARRLDRPGSTSGDGVRVIATTRIVDLRHAEEILASGRADLVGMTRALIADPALGRKARTGRPGEVIECIGCNQACIGHYHAGVPIGCSVNPRTGRERRFGVVARAPRRVLVVGAGPAGIAAAVEAARVGDDVTLIERENDIGGQLRLAGRAPAHAEMWRRWRRGALRDLVLAGVTPLLGAPVDEPTLRAHEHVIVATGARPYMPALPSPPGVTVIDAWQAIVHPGVVAGPVLVADWGGEWSGLDAAEMLAAAGLRVELACAATVPGETLHQYQRNAYLARLDRAGVTIRHHLELAAVDGEIALRHVFSGRLEPLGAARTLVLAQGRRPEAAVWRMAGERPGVGRAGDVLGPRTLEEAVLEGFLAGRAEALQAATGAGNVQARAGG
jgi:2,4-dienoyl-CoA reductase-like NADH-dependent reductase (Old Yellow Enzyme family)